MFMGSNGRKETNSEKIVLYARKHKKYRVKNVQKSDGSGFKASLPQDKTGTPAAVERRQPYRNEVYSGQQRKTEHIQSENVLSDVSETTNPEMAERLKKAAFIERRNAENIKMDRTAAAYGGEDHHDKISDVPVEHQEETVKKAAEKTEDVIADIVIPDHVRAITPEMAERLKRAAYIEQKNAEAIRLNRATVIRETEKETQETNTDNVDPAENIPDVPVEHREENEDNSPNGTPPDSADTDLHSDEVREYWERKAYHDFSGKHKRESKKYFGVSDGYPHKRNDDAEKSGDAAVETAFGENVIKTAYEAETAAQTINNSDSIGSTVLDLSAALSVVEAKKMVKKLAETDLKKQERVSERMKNHGNRFGIGSDAKDEEIRDKAEKIKYSEDQPKQYEGDGKKRRHYKVGNGIRLNEEKQKYARNQRRYGTSARKYLSRKTAIFPKRLSVPKL